MSSRKSSRSHSHSSEFSCPTAKGQETMDRPIATFLHEKVTGQKVRMSSFLGKRHRTRGGNMHVAYYVTNNLTKPWLYMERIDDLHNQRREDTTWVETAMDVPCFEQENIPHGKVKKTKALGKCGTQEGTSRVFKWNDAYLLVTDLQKCQEDSRTEAAEFLEAIKGMAESSFGYHCVRSDGSGIGKGYFTEAWNETSHIALIATDCGQSGDSDECSFIVLGFALLRNYSGKVQEKFQYNQRYMNELIRVSDRTMPENALYVDVVCSKFSIAQVLLKMLCESSGSKKWKNLVFGPGADKHPHYVFLRAIASVYTYNPIQYGFQRSIDAQRVAPIFKLSWTELKALLNDQDPGNQIDVTQMFGPQGEGNNLRWRLIQDKKDKKGEKLYIYKLGKEFMNFQKKTFAFKENDMEEVKAYILEEKRKFLALFKPTMFVCGDMNKNGYLYGLYVDA